MARNRQKIGFISANDMCAICLKKKYDQFFQAPDIFLRLAICVLDDLATLIEESGNQIFRDLKIAAHRVWAHSGAARQCAAEIRASHGLKRHLVGPAGLCPYSWWFPVPRVGVTRRSKSRLSRLASRLRRFGAGTTTSTSFDLPLPITVAQRKRDFQLFLNRNSALGDLRFANSVRICESQNHAALRRSAGAISTVNLSCCTATPRGSLAPHFAILKMLRAVRCTVTRLMRSWTVPSPELVGKVATELRLANSAEAFLRLDGRAIVS